MKWTKVFGGSPEQPVFEALLAELSARFADVPAREIGTEIERALARLCTIFGRERCTFSEFGPDERIHIVASAALPECPPLPKGPFVHLPWLHGELAAGRVVAMPDLPNGLPPEASAEAEFCRRAGMRSHLSIPLQARGRLSAVLSFSGLREAHEWPADVITRLTIVGEILAGSLARARSEEETQHLRARLWHADRVARIGTLTAAIAHEINQPLAAILSNAQAGLARLARGDAAPEALREALEAVVRDNRRATQTIRTMRGFLRQEESGRARIDLSDAMRDVLQLLAAELGRHGLRVESDLAPGCWVRADRTQLEQVVMNLVLNAAEAMKSTPGPERVLHVSAARASNGNVAVRVRDAGCGIAAEPIESVFEPLWTTRKDGLGLGLAICRSIVEAHGGTIGVERNPGRGVTFGFELSGDGATAMARSDAAAAERRETVAPAAQAGPLVCIVDDDVAVREGLTRRLAIEGYAVRCYASATEFLEQSHTEDIGCLVLDLQLPGVSGLELQQRLAALPATPPVVFLTGSDDLSAGVDAMKRGAVDFLRKPVDEAQLFAAVRSALEQYDGRRVINLQRRALAGRLARLSAREREVMDHVVRGRLNKQIAASLNIALQTVKQHRARVMEKMEASSVAELIALLGPDQPSRAMIGASAETDTQRQSLPPA